MARRRKALSPTEPLRHADHRRPITRRDFLAQGFLTGAGLVMGGSIFSLLASPRQAHALSGDLDGLRSVCGIATQGAGKIPFICFDLAGGANFAGSNVLVGGQDGQLDLVSTAGYGKLGLPGDMIPGLVEAAPPVITAVDGTTFSGNGDYTNTDLGLAFHSDSQLLRGILEKVGVGAAGINGAVIPARSDNDTGNNPHNPMYGIARCGADGELVTLIGSRSSDSGGNSMAPAMMVDPQIRPTKVDRPSDVTGMVDTGELNVVFQDPADVVAVMESIQRISDRKLSRVQTKVTRDAVIKDLVRCGYVKAADLAERFSTPDSLDPARDPLIVGAGGIFSDTEFASDREFRKTASVMKMVIDGRAGAGTVTIGGYDYHTGERATGEARDLRAGRCIGACLAYAARRGVPLMVYVLSDGSVASNGRIDDSPETGPNSPGGRGKGEWTGDNSSTAASFFLVYDPNGRPALLGGSPEEQARHQQIGFFRPDASVETSATPAANQVNLLVETVVLNYLALHGEQGRLDSLFPGHGLGGAAQRDRLTAFAPIVSGTI